MAYVVTSNCTDCRFTDCVEVCPVDCFYLDDRQVYINPDECIDCGACEPTCPVEAIYPGDDVPAAEAQWVKTNAEKTASGSLTHITESRSPLPTADAKKKQLGL
jgi:ferredoxin